MKSDRYYNTDSPLDDFYRDQYNPKWGRVNLYCSEVFYVRSLLQTKFGRKFSLEEVYRLLKEEYPDFNYRM